MTKTVQEPKIITVFNQKGGCAKTMTTMQLAGAFGLMGLRVFVVDMDPQNTSALWSIQATADEPFPATVLSLAPMKENFIDKLMTFVGNYDLILIDCPPSVESRVPWTSLLIADMGLIPVIPVLDNVWASKQAEELLLEARKTRIGKGDNTPLHAAYLLSVVRRGKVFDMCQETLAAKATIPILKSKVAMRNAFPESQVYGCVAKSFDKKSPAATEIDEVAREVAAIIGLKLPKKG